MVPPSPPRSRVKCEIFRTNVLEDGWGYRPQAASVSEPRASASRERQRAASVSEPRVRPSENMAQIRGLVPVLPSQRNSDLGFCHPREPKCPFATAPRGPNRAFAPTFPPPQRIQPACPSDVPPEPGRAARARSRIGRELRAPARSSRKKRSGPAEGAAGPEGGGMRLSQEPLSAFQRQSRQVIGGDCLTCWAQYNNHP